MNPVVECCIVGGWWCPHGSPLQLLPVGVTKDKIIMSHDTFETIDGCLEGEIGKIVVVGSKPLVRSWLTRIQSGCWCTSTGRQQ